MRVLRHVETGRVIIRERRDRHPRLGIILRDKTLSHERYIMTYVWLDANVDNRDYYDADASCANNAEE